MSCSCCSPTLKSKSLAEVLAFNFDAGRDPGAELNWRWRDQEASHNVGVLEFGHDSQGRGLADRSNSRIYFCRRNS